MTYSIRRSAWRLTRLGGLGLAAALAFGTGCSDDGGGGGGPDATPPDAPPPDAYAGDGVAPTVAVIFPPPSSLTDTDTITLRGTAEDVDAIADIRIDGTSVTTEDEFATWTATVQLSHGENVIVIESEDEYGAIDTAAAELSVTLSAYWTDSPTAIAADEANDRAFTVDFQLDAVLAIDYATGERILISDDDRGEGGDLSEPVDVAVDQENGRVFVIDQSPARLIEVDLESGDRAIVADPDGDPALLNPTEVVLDLANNRALVLDVDDSDADPAPPTLYAVDLTEGDTFGERTLIADPDQGAGNDLVSARGLALDPAGGRVLVGDVDPQEPNGPRVSRVYFVDLESGDRSDPVTSSDDDTQGPGFDDPRALVFDTSTDPITRFFMLDQDNDIIYAVDIESGARTVVTEESDEFTGPEFGVPVAMDLDVDADGNARLLVVDSPLDAFLAVDVDTGARSILSGVFLGAGPRLTQPTSMLYDALGGPSGRALLLDAQDELLIEVDLSTSERNVLVDDEGAPNEVFGDPQSLTPTFFSGLSTQSETIGEVVVADPNKDALFRVDLDTGALTVLSGDKNDGSGELVGAGDPFDQPRDVIFDPGDGDTPARYLVVDRRQNTPGALLAVDPDTGDRTVISDADTGTGDFPLDDPVGLTLELDDDGPTGRVLVIDEGLAVLFAVDLDTGARTILSGQGVGDGSDLVLPRSILLELEAGDGGADYKPTGYALVSHGGIGSLLAIELSNGRRTELLSNMFGKGPLIDDPRTVWPIPEYDLMLIADQGLDALVMLDRTNNDRVLLTR